MAKTEDVAGKAPTFEQTKQLQAESQAFQLQMAQLQTQDAKSKAAIAMMEALAASDRSNSDRVAQYIGK